MTREPAPQRSFPDRAATLDHEILLDALAGYPRVLFVDSFEALLATPLANGINALCWRRSLPGDFAEVATRLEAEEGINAVEDEDLLALGLSAAGREARRCIFDDLQRLRDANLSPSLDAIRGHTRDDRDLPFPVDVYSFHADSATVEADTYLCAYAGACSEGLRNDQALKRVDLPATRAELLKLYGGPDDDSFRAFLNEGYYDLHYLPAPHARIFPFGVGNLWRIATEYPGAPVPPCIHRAPTSSPLEPTRLLLIS